jgi:hypothetical protein
MNNFYLIRFLVFAMVMLLQQKSNAQQNEDAALLLKFEYSANNKPLVLGDSSYTNAFGESYRVTKLRYYISNPGLQGNGNSQTGKEVFLLDAANEDSIPLKVKPGTYHSLFFTLGVDSALNSSGAQTGALDPLHGMFWTWNSGYVFFKLEGYSPASTADLQRIEHHIGGYMPANKASRQIVIALEQPVIFKKGDQRQMIINVNLDKYWRAQNDISIASNALIMEPGALAKSVSNNFQAMFFPSAIR